MSTVALDCPDPNGDQDVIEMSIVPDVASAPSSPGVPDIPNQPSVPSVPSASDVANSPSAPDIFQVPARGRAEVDLQLSESELRLLEQSSRPGWVPPACAFVLRLLPESVRRVAQVVNRAHALGKKLITAAEVGAELERLGWKPYGSSNNGVGDHLGKRGLKLRRVSITGGFAYMVPAGGITPEYLRSLGYDV